MTEPEKDNTPGTPIIPVEKLISAFLTIRDKRTEIKQLFDAEDNKLKEALARLQSMLRQRMEQQGTTQLGSDEATAYQEVSQKFSCADWPNYWEWIAENGRYDMVQKRVGEKALSEYMAETGELPPGINVFQEYNVVVRRK